MSNQEQEAIQIKNWFEKFNEELIDAADDYWISYNYCVAQGKKRDYFDMSEENLDDGNPNEEEEDKTCWTCKKEYEVEPGRGSYDGHQCWDCYVIENGAD